MEWHHLLLAAALTLVTTAIHGLCTAGVIRVVAGLRHEHWLMRSITGKVFAVAALVMLLLAASLLEAWLWSLAYLAAGAIDGAEKALYFSIVTFTTLGYGDITLPEGWRLVGALQAAVGIIVFGWSTALVIAGIQKLMSPAEERLT